ncbi:Mu-like prophage major head subunit gpT family protein [Sporomusa sphaeroides DSM 2875]|uniref:Mu-like prophage major head subunit gpT family protein n=1 Tax=Sporomusa sphaeroides TaxID=47679 RepID=UPI002030A3CD|nr:Mu-like prophage major head subunit gpT family protein [Sporomusa sphaeroides]MCM0757354.1 Mu-like prophage major head subunit gpT family protein [Sporomusa sphaeroides DSM 2875]
MLLNSSNLQGLYQSFKVLFNKAFSGTKPQYEKVATIVPSKAKEETYAWLGSFPRLREWIGDRVINKLKAFGYTIKNKSFEASVSVNRDDIEDDTYGVYSPMIEEMGSSAATHPDEIVFDLLPKGFTTLCYDGQYFFDTDHKDGDGPVQSNKGTAALSKAAYMAARSQMMSLTDDKGEPLGVITNLLVVPPQLEEKAREILLADEIDGTTNTAKGTAELLVVPRLAKNATAWYLIDGSRSIKPLIFQQRKKAEFVALTDPTDINVFMRKEYLYGVDCRDNAGYGLWQLAYGSTGTE